MEGKNQKVQQSERPRRGRPTGKNRVPLNLEERRARNALYEKERREDTARAMAELAEAVGCDTNMIHSDLIATVISFIQSKTANGREDIEALQSCNEKLLSQIADCEQRLGVEEDAQAFVSPEIEKNPPINKVKRKHDNAESNGQIAKKRKKKKKSTATASIPDAVVPQTFTEVSQEEQTELSSGSNASTSSVNPGQQMIGTPYAVPILPQWTQNAIDFGNDDTVNSGINTVPSEGCLSAEENYAIQSFFPVLEDPAPLPDDTLIDLNSIDNFSISDWIDNYL